MVKAFRGIAITGLLIVAASLTHAQMSLDLEIKRAYKDLIEAENRHDLAAVKGMLWDSPSALFVAKAPVGWHRYWGINDVIQHLHDMYQQPFRIDPAYEEEKVVLITTDVAETYAPVKITVAYGGQTPTPKPFIMVLVWIKAPKGWKMTTDIPIPVPPEPAPQPERGRAGK